MRPSIINLTLVVGLWLGLIGGCCNSFDSNWNKKSDAPSPTPTATTSTDSSNTGISAVELFNEWKRDKAAADAKYKDKTLVVTGKIRLINDTSVVLNSGEKSDVLGVQCILTEKGRADSKRLSEGQTITVEGLCVGRIGNIVLRNCTVR